MAIDCEADDKTSPLQQGIKKMSSTNYNAIVNDADLREAAAKLAASSASSGETGHSWPVWRSVRAGVVLAHVLKNWRRARDSNPQGACAPVDFKSTALPVRASPPGQKRPSLTIHQPVQAP